MRLCTIDETNQCLPDINGCENLAEWNRYLDSLYQNVFKKDFLDTCPTFKGWKVLIRKEPKDGEREHSFTHMTHVDYFHKTKDPNDRIPDLRRSERLAWVRVIIEHYNCSISKDCNQLLYWEELFRGRIRSCLLFYDERFLVVLEKARDVYFIITSYYLEEDWELDKRYKKYQRYQKQKTPLV